ncbi:hypothetical protein AT6N2_C0715 [Agrobacterium tumefaciens]|nr:hypothetical protein AT6N2_C0715 [Agrobacterium tumefaciens]
MPALFRLQDEGEDTARALEITLPQFVSGKARQGRMQNTHDIVAAFQPCGNIKRAFLMMRQPDAHSADAAQDLVRVVRCDADAEIGIGLIKRLPVLFIGRDEAHQDIRMTRGIFGGGMDGDIDAEIQGLEIKRRRPGIVHRHDAIMPVRDIGDQPHILNFEGVGARRFQMHQLRVRADQGLDAFPDRRIVIFHLDAQLFQHRVAEAAGGEIDGINDQGMIARTEIGEERHGDGGKARRDENGPGRTLKRVDHVAQRVGRRRAMRAIGIFLVFGRKRLGIREKHGRATHDGRVDETETIGGIVTAMGQARIYTCGGKQVISLGHFRSAFEGILTGRQCGDQEVRSSPEGARPVHQHICKKSAYNKYTKFRQA